MKNLISEAVEKNDIVFLKENLDKFNPNQNGQYDYPLLHRACYLGHLETIEFLIDNGADIDILDKFDSTPLSSIIDGNENNWFDCIELLINKGSKLQEDILIEAVRNEIYIEVIKLLLDNGADIDYIDGDGDKAINYAYDKNLYETIKLLEQYGAVYDGKITNEEQILRDYAIGMLESDKLRENRNK